MINRRFVMGCALVLLVAAGCSRSAIPAPTTVVLPPPTAQASPSHAAQVSTSPAATPPVTARPIIPTSPAEPPPLGDTRLGACFFGPQLNVVNLPCVDLAKMGVRNTFFGAWWGQIESQPGEYDWTTVDGPVDAALACGVEPVIKISASPGPGESSSPPEDMGAYSRFVSALAEHLKGRVRVYAIENEVNNGKEVWTGDTYGPLRAAAYAAIKSADPTAWMLDGGMTMQAYLPARASELAQAGRTQDAIAMLQRFEANMTRTQKNLPSTEEELTHWLSNPIFQRALDLVDELRKNPDTFDAVQIHYLQDAWELIPEYVNWVKAWFPGKEFEFWEIGYGWPGEETGQPFSEEGHAEGVIKTLVSALGEGASRVIYEPYWEEIRPGAEDRAARKFGRGLMTSEGPRLAATAYRTMAGQLSGYESAERLDLGAGVWTYRFVTPGGDVYVVWASEDTEVPLPIAASQVNVTDLYGNRTVADPAAVPVGFSPAFVAAP